MEIKLKHYDLTITANQPDDINSTDLLETFVKLMYVLGYHPNSIKQAILAQADEIIYENLCNE
jgi:hypothetical protein